METFVARQPVFTRRYKIYGYELLFRRGGVNAFPEIDGGVASSKLISETFLSLGIERITGGKRAFVNFTQELLLQKTPLMFPHRSMTVEILEDVQPTPAVVEACREIAKAGYQLVMDDFLYRPELTPLIELAKIIKIDFRATPVEEIGRLFEQLSRYPVKFLAEKVETHEEFERALEMGFQYFQGFFFSKPIMIRGKDIVPDKLSLLRIMAEANQEDCRFEELERLISYDVSISYKLLRYINSAYYKRLGEISSIRQAITRLGEKGIKRFISLIAMTSLASDKPDELVRASIVRARLCELLGAASPGKVDQDGLFTLGLFSLIDAMLDEEMEKIMATLPLSEKIKKALVEGTGEFAGYLELVAAYESADWQTVFELAKKMGIEEEKMPELYLDSVGWADRYSDVGE